MTDAGMEPWEVATREAIRDLVARYNAFGDAGRLDALVGLFTDTAVLEVDGREHRGASEIRALFEAAARSTRARAGGHVRHFTATHRIDVAGEATARGRCYFLVLTEAGLDHWGRYRDDYRRVGSAWRFERRGVDVDGRIPGGWADERR